MRSLTTFHLRYPDVRAARSALAAGAVAGLVVIAACTDAGNKSITAPQAPRAAVIASNGFGQAKILSLCVDASAPAGTYTFKNIALNRNKALDGFSNPLAGNGFWDGSNWNDQGDGGTGTTSAPGGLNTNYDVSPGGCVQVLTRTQGDTDFSKNIPSTCTVNCKENDSFAAANVLFVSASNGYVYDHTDCTVDNGDLMPQHINPTTGSPPVPTVLWPQSGFDNTSAFTTYGCASSNNPSRGFVNYEHGTTLTFYFTAPLTTHNCTFTQGYYKNHDTYTAGVLSGNVSTTYIDASGHLLIGAYALTAAQVDDILSTPVGKGYNAGGVTFTKDQLAMIHQLITAELNIAGGASPATVAATITAANANYTTASKSQLSSWTDTLDSFNNGNLGPSHCS